jgi:drug/metabolite transporter (DMT)-like permease
MPFIGEICALATAVLWSVTSIVFTEASIRVGPIYVNITRMILAMGFLFITLLLIGVNISLSLYQVFNLMISGFIGLVIGDTFLFKAFQNIGARLSMLVMALVPPISTLLAFLFLGESISLTGITGILITIFGVAIVVLKREEKPSSNYKIDYTGIFYAFIGAAGQAGGLIFAKNALNVGEINGFLASFLRIISAVIIMYPIAHMTSRFKGPIKIFKNDKRAFVFTLIGSIVGPYLGITLSMVSITYTKIGIASTLMATVPIIMLPLVRYYYKEKLSWVSITGAVVAVAGIAILFLH